MKLTLQNVRNIRKETDNKLTKRVCSYVIDEWSDYSDKKNIFTDVLYYGCQSGMVTFLIWYSDTVAFYKKYKQEINELLTDTMASIGTYSFTDLFGDKWDKEDPLGQDDYNQNLLAWFGFEEALRNLGMQFEALQDCI